MSARPPPATRSLGCAAGWDTHRTRPHTRATSITTEIEGMNYWLMKSEPSVFGIDDLARAKNSTASWDGVRNFQARNYLREMKKGDLAFFYHSSCDVPGIAGVAAIQREAYPDPTAFDSKHDHYDPDKIG